MKTGAALFLSALLATLCGSFVDANGVCYDPDHTTGKNADSVAKDIATIKSKGFTYVRTYISKFGNTDMVKQIASSGLKVVAGVPYGQGDYTTQLEAAVAATSTGNVVYIMLGNENLANLNSVPGALIQAIKDLKARVPGVKVGTVQRNTEFLKNIDGLADLVAACDVIGVNIHPYFMGSQGTNGANAIETFKSQWNKIIGSSIPGIADKLFLGETGWPSDGSLGGNQGTVSGASAYFSAYKAWSASLPENKKFYFQLFDQPYKPEAYEKAYGLLTYDSQDKLGGASVPASTTAAPTTAPTPASTPAPTPTPAPTATPAASANSTSSSTGSSSSSGSSSKDLKSAGSGSAGSLATAGSESVASSSSSPSSPTESSETTTTQGETGAEAEIAGVNGRTTVDTPFVDNSKYAGASGSTTETNTQSEGSGSSVGVAFGVAAGCAAVLGAFGFIYHTRKKAQELEEAESKMSFSVTPHGGCVL